MVQSLAWSEMTRVSIWLMCECMGGVKVIVPVNFRHVTLPVATVSLVGAAAVGGALRTNGAQNDTKIAANDSTGHLGRRGGRSRTVVNTAASVSNPRLLNQSRWSWSDKAVSPNSTGRSPDRRPLHDGHRCGEPRKSVTELNQRDISAGDAPTLCDGSGRGGSGAPGDGRGALGVDVIGSRSGVRAGGEVWGHGVQLTARAGDESLRGPFAELVDVHQAFGNGAGPSPSSRTGRSCHTRATPSGTKSELRVIGE